MKKIFQLALFIFMLASLVGVPAGQASADTNMVVNSTVDGTLSSLNANTSCDLREAMTNANNNAQTYTDCLGGSGTDTITFSVGGTMTLVAPLPDVTSAIIINGNSVTPTIIQASACDPVNLPGGCTPAAYGIFKVNGGGGNLTINRLTLQNGNRVSPNLNYGGAIYTSGQLTVKNSTFLNNNSEDGGAIANVNGTVYIGNSTFAYNKADEGGALKVFGGTTTITNATFAYNSAVSHGGSIWNGGVLNLRNSILANTPNGMEDCFNDASDTIAENLNNLIETNGVSGHMCGIPSLQTDPALGALGYNGNSQFGDPTQTLPLMGISPAIDAGDHFTCQNNNLVFSTDQRGISRNVDGNADGVISCDMGAYEAFTAKRSSAKTSDGYILEATEASNKGGTKNNKASTVFIGDDSLDRQYRAILSFPTQIEDEKVISVVLRIKKSSIVGGGNPFNTFGGLMVDIKKGNFGTETLALSDFKAAGSLSLGPFKPVVENGWYTIDLSDAKDFINTDVDGNTQIRLRFKKDDNDNSAANILKIFSGNSGNAPQLIIEYVTSN